MTNGGTLDDLYLTWLYSQVADVEETNSRNTHWKVFNHLFRVPFEWVVSNDDNREEDGKALRNQFITQCDIEDIEINWLQLECSMLEMLVALAERSSFEAPGTTADWFWIFLKNLKLNFSDYAYNKSIEREVDVILQRFVQRTYQPNGVGGLFPLKNAQYDQRDVELWYQLSAYLLESEYADND